MKSAGIKDLIPGSSLDSLELNYRSLLEGLAAAVYACDAYGRIILYNQAAADLWGREPELGKDLWCGSWKIYNPDGSPMPLGDCPMAICLKEGRSVEGKEIIVERPDGVRIHVQPHPRPIIENGKVAGAINLLIDITEKKKAEKIIQENETKYRQLADSLEKKVSGRTEDLQMKNQELERSEERYHKMVEEVEDYAIILMDKDGMIQNWNKGAEKIKGYKEQEIVGQNFRLFYMPEDRARELPEQLIGEAVNKGRAAHEGWRQRKDGSLFWGSVVITALHNDQNEVIGFSKVTRDLTEKKLAEEKAQQYTAELEQFAYIASHDLQEPLRKIQVFTELMEQNLDNAEATAKYLRKINSSAARMSLLIKDVLHYTVVSNREEEFIDTDLNKVLREVLEDFELLISQKQVKISHPEMPVIKGIPVQLRQLFANLLSNSIKFSDKDPVIEISWERMRNGAIKDIPELDANRRYLKISFRDNGMGFEEKYSEKIFKLFQRLHQNVPYGTGIGLALCKRIVENHQGYIRVLSKLHKGSTFQVFLPE